MCAFRFHFWGRKVNWNQASHVRASSVNQRNWTSYPDTNDLDSGSQSYGLPQLQTPWKTLHLVSFWAAWPISPSKKQGFTCKSVDNISATKIPLPLPGPEDSKKACNDMILSCTAQICGGPIGTLTCSWSKQEPRLIPRCAKKKHIITLLRVIPTMTFIHFVTGKSSGILSDIFSAIRSGISSGILSGISSGRCSGISSGIPSGILSGIPSGILPGISSGICSGISSGIPSGVLSSISSGILSGKSSGILSGIFCGILSDILSGILFGILSGKHSGTLSGISSGILSDILSGILSGIPSGILPGISYGILSDILSGISSGILSGRWVQQCALSWEGPQVEVQRCALSSEGPRLRSSGAHWARKAPGWGPAARTELGRSQVEVQRCALSWEGPRLRASGAHWAGKVPGWGQAVRTELGRSQVEVQRCALSWEVGEELGEELARRRCRWKLMQTWSRRNWRRRTRRTRRRRRRGRSGERSQFADCWCFCGVYACASRSWSLWFSVASSKHFDQWLPSDRMARESHEWTSSSATVVVSRIAAGGLFHGRSRHFWEYFIPVADP